MAHNAILRSMASERNKYSIWFGARGEAEEQLQELIDTLAQEYKTPSFPPHISVVANIFATGAEFQEVKYATERLARELESFTARLSRLSYLDEEFRSLFYIAESDKFEEMYDVAARYFPQVREEHFAAMPHLSVLYGDFDRTTKEKIITEYQTEPIELTIDVMDLYLTNAPVSTWERVHRFELE